MSNAYKVRAGVSNSFSNVRDACLQPGRRRAKAPPSAAGVQRGWSTKRSSAIGLQPIIRLITLAYYNWALREMGPQHPDFPRVAARIRELEDAPFRA